MDGSMASTPTAFLMSSMPQLRPGHQPLVGAAVGSAVADVSLRQPAASSRGGQSGVAFAALTLAAVSQRRRTNRVASTVAPGLVTSGCLYALRSPRVGSERRTNRVASKAAPSGAVQDGFAAKVAQAAKAAVSKKVASETAAPDPVEDKSSEPPAEAVDLKPEPVSEHWLACPVCQCALTSNCGCPRCNLRFPKETEGNFVDLLITSAEPSLVGEDEQLVKETTSALPTGDDSLLQRLPGVKQLDAVAKNLGLPTSEDVEGLAKEVVRDVQKVVPKSSDGAMSVTTFQNPLVSFAYERGWRQAFEANGFPGPDEEYSLAKAFLEEPLKARDEADRPPVLLDCSCGSGLFTRRFASDQQLGFQEVIALDFSESMLRQTDAYCAKEAGATYEDYAQPLRLIRGDVGRLPLQTGSLAGAHAGAAIHCWPAPEVGLAELARVLEPGAVLVLSTFTKKVMGGRLALGSGNAGSGFRFWEVEELRTLMRQVGLVNFESVQKDPAFIMVKAEKPKAP